MRNFTLDRILDENGMVLRCPPKLGQRVEVVAYLCGAFQEDHTYTELEVNELIRSKIHFSDYVTMRRELVDFGFLRRTPDGKVYTRNAVLPTVESIMAKF